MMDSDTHSENSASPAQAAERHHHTPPPLPSRSFAEVAGKLCRSRKARELASYIFWGAATTLVNFVVYFFATRLAGTPVVPATVLAWIVAVLFAFFTNKLWVFGSKSLAAKTVFRELSAFISARLTSGAAEILLMWLFVDLLGVNDFVMKIATNVVVIVLNYVFSLCFVFRKKA